VRERSSRKNSSALEEDSNFGGYQLNRPQMHATLHSEFIQSDRWAEALQTLDLSLEEVIHIRSVLTKAEMEGLPLDGTLKEDVERGRVCFLCMKTRFGFWAGYGCKCQLCKQKVCQKCSAKMSIPLEQFSTTPVFVLGPPASASTNNGKKCDSRKQPKVRKSDSFIRTGSFRSRMSSFLGGGGGRRSCDHGSTNSCNSSVPNSPNLGRQNSQGLTASLETFRNFGDEEDEYANTVVASASSVTNLTGGLFTNRRKQSNPKTSTEMMNICEDCKEMVLQVIRAQSTARRLQLAKQLFIGQAGVADA